MAYTTIDDPSAYFQTALHSSTGSATITNDGNSDLQPDLIWSKSRSQARNHALYDSTRGVTKYVMSNLTDAEATADSGFDLTSFDTDGFSTGNNQFNVICGGDNYVAWQWKANGGTTASNTDGTITSTVQANTTAGFSIVTYTGTGSGATIGHGVGKELDFIIIKRRSDSATWAVYSRELGSGKKLELNGTSGTITNAQFFTSNPTSSVFSLGTEYDVNGSGGTFVAYCFAEKQGYSKFGSYNGNGNADGPFVYLGFKPAWLMIKRTDAISDGWYIFDSTRSPTNLVDKAFRANANNAESGESIDLLSNGFKHRIGGNNNFNNASGTYIYMAFAEHPFVSSKGVPTTAR